MNRCDAGRGHSTPRAQHTAGPSAQEVSASPGPVLRLQLRADVHGGDAAGLTVQTSGSTPWTGSSTGPRTSPPCPSCISNSASQKHRLFHTRSPSWLVTWGDTLSVKPPKQETNQVLDSSVPPLSEGGSHQGLRCRLLRPFPLPPLRRPPRPKPEGDSSSGAETLGLTLTAQGRSPGL